MEPFLPRTRLASIHQVWRSWSSFPKGLYSEEQLASYEAQVDYYTRFIRSNPDWEFMDAYTDEGISTLNTKHRDGFNRMIEDALAGKVTMPYSSFLGYRKGADGLPEIVPEEASIVRQIYTLFIQGKTLNWIAKHLTEQGVPTPRGKAKWQSSTVESILTNEKYKGCAILQKKFTVDFLSKKMKVNEGEVPQYIVEQSHPAIIDPDQWEKVQTEMEFVSELTRKLIAENAF